MNPPSSGLGRVVNVLAEVDWTSAEGDLVAYVQGIYLGQHSGLGWDEDLIVRSGLRWTIIDNLSLSAQHSQDLETYGNRPEDSTTSIQLRFVF